MTEMTTKLIKPHGDVIRMSIEILHRMKQSPKGNPGEEYARRKQGGDHKTTLFNDIAKPFINGVIVEMIFVVADLPGEGILFTIGSDNDLKRTQTKTGMEGFTGHFFMDGNKHSKIINEVSVIWL